LEEERSRSTVRMVGFGIRTPCLRATTRIHRVTGDKGEPVRVRVRFKNKQVVSYNITDDSFKTPIARGKGVFFTIGTNADNGQPVVISLDDVVSIEPQSDDDDDSGLYIV
jgi:hypothetical protein